MFADPVTITVDAVDHEYGLVSVKDQASQRLNGAAEVGEPDAFSISHEMKGKGSTAVDRHLVRVDTTIESENPDGSVTHVTVSAYVVIVVPRVVATKADATLAYEKVATFLGGTEAGASLTNLERVLAGEP